jgi:hypothetical protein
MSRFQPAYFEPIRKKADELWQLLEKNPDLMAPWVHLFRQVQSPRHVLSELMQNADDVGATTAVVSMEDNYFSFLHDGEDFNETNFQSICRFGFSNKREMHTIGFRGLGFKSTFSLGKEVMLLTPTLSVSFHADRFIVPVWNQEVPRRTGWTEIRIKVTDRLRFEEFRKNLDDWLKTGFSLLFFRNIRSLKIGAREITWVERANGPVNLSQWMTVKGSEKAGYLIARSVKLDFPPECQEEIRKERQVFDTDQVQMPPCTVEIIAGAKGRLHVIVPTSVETNLPFTINAPFVQDPARIKLKELELSPTNRWLLEQVGVLASKLIVDWVCHSNDSVEKRAQAYSLLAVDNEEDLDDLAVRVLRMVDTQMSHQLAGKNFLLDVQGEAHPSGKCFTVDSVIQNVWPSAVVTATFGKDGAHLLHNSVRDCDRHNLAKKGYVNITTKEDVLDRLRVSGVPKPQTFHQLLKLWNHLTQDLSSGPYSLLRADIHILPVLNDNNLACASETHRVQRTSELTNPADWDFFGNHLKILDSDWFDFLSVEIGSDDSSQDGNQIEKRKSALKLMEILGLSNQVGLPRLINHLAKKLKEDPRNQLENCVRLTHIAAGVKADLPEQFPFFNRYGGACIVGSLVRDPDGFIENHLPENLSRKLLLHPFYFLNNSSCTEEKWNEWVMGPQSGLLAFPLPRSDWSQLDGKEALLSLLEIRCYTGPVQDHYQRKLYELADWDYPPEAWACWDEHGANDPLFWERWMRHFLSIGTDNLRRACGVSIGTENLSRAWGVKIWQVATTIKKKLVVDETVLPSWAIQLRERTCLIDTNGRPEKPELLMVRTPESKPFEGHLRFVAADLDTESNRPILLAIGAKAVCDDPSYFLNCLRALAKSSIPPLDEVLRLYRMLDNLLPFLGTKLQELIDAFQREPLLYTALGEWITTEDRRVRVGSEYNVVAETRKLKLWSILIKRTGTEPPPPPPPPSQPPPIDLDKALKDLSKKHEIQPQVLIALADEAAGSSRKYRIRPQDLLVLGEEAARNLPDSRKRPVEMEAEPFPFKGFFKSADWVLELFPSGCNFQKLIWEDGSTTLQLVDGTGKTLLAKHIPSEEPEPTKTESGGGSGSGEEESLSPGWDAFMKDLTKDLE